MTTIDLYQTVTNKILEQLEQGVTPWIKPWKTDPRAGALLPYNAMSGKSYRGINTWMLMSSPYRTSAWMTYKQAQDIGAQVRKGEKGTMIVFWKPWTVTDANDPESKGRTIHLLRHFTVFNVDQIDNIPDNYLPAAPLPVTEESRWQEVNAIQALPTIIPGGNQACFIPSKDAIAMPPVASFRTREDWACTLLHEVTHWTGHQSRLAREYGKKFGDTAYAREELVAEMGAAFLCAHAGVDGQLQHANYLAAWIKILTEDKRAIMVAASHAQKAADYVLTAIGQSRADEIPIDLAA